MKGIYATALTELLVESGIPVVDASPQLKARFGDSVSSRGVALVTVKDKEDRRGVVVIGKKDLAQRVLEVLKTALALSPIVVMPGELYATYVCRALGGTLVELPGGQVGYFEEGAREGELVVAHVVSFREGRPVLRRGAAVVGVYARLVEGGAHGVSEHIRGPQRATLLSLAESFGLKGWGVRWRSSARWADPSVLSEELRTLGDLAERVRERVRELNRPEKVTEGEILALVPFALDDKRRLDGIRARRVPTLPYHHLAKACGEKYSALVDALERFPDRRSEAELADKVLELLESEIAGGRLRVVHETPIGKAIELRGEATVVGRKPLVIELRRRISGGGVYDGLGVAKEEGDTAVSLIALGSYVLPHAYFSADGVLKGLYVNVNTPIEPCPPDAVWYVDAFVDVVWSDKDGVRIVDLDELRNSKAFSEQAVYKLEVIAHKVAEMLKREENNARNDPLSFMKKMALDINFFTAPQTPSLERGTSWVASLSS